MNHLSPFWPRLLFAFALSVALAGCLANTVEEVSASSDDPLACTVGSEQRCQQSVDPEHEGVSFCVETEAGAAWSECAVNPAKGSDDCDPSGEIWNGFCCAERTSGCCPGDDCMTPLVLAFHDAPVRFTSAVGSSFDLSGLGREASVDWPTSATPWLALDRDGSGAIEGGHELFGSAVALEPGRFARTGFEALAVHDTNRDGWIDVLDPVWERLLVWRDANANRSSEAGELTAVRASGVERIGVDYDLAPSCDARGNCAIERASIEFIDEGLRRRGSVVDVHLTAR